ncbi:uncharacterized protein ACA1_094160 [Acanthamoeba castellanii str. Neff]|uniref:Uncharacterized protein n=1 Tax=Acanthamoeba castellanii (strain ATCC 30010 / Neff) TaxID=1257118 RepID=L8GJ31_ACACF|nr:uncharacterized protein ACA1_094160 [Acanthamoeba castellanii str. Neff]ELR12859.1 hypothetical protein ACA1_094160 [Acanthamoeba castellanii str. Neff]
MPCPVLLICGSLLPLAVREPRRQAYRASSLLETAPTPSGIGLDTQEKPLPLEEPADVVLVAAAAGHGTHDVIVDV